MTTTADAQRAPLPTTTTTPPTDRRRATTDRRAEATSDVAARGSRREVDIVAYLTEHETGKPVTTEQLAYAIGVSTTTIRADIKHGALKAFKAGGRVNTRREYRVKFAEAKRYLIQMGVIDAPRAPRAN